MEHGHARARDDLRPFEERVRLRARSAAAQLLDEPGEQPASSEAQECGDDQAVDDLHPLVAVHARQAALQGDGRAGDAGDERVALRGGDAEVPRSHTPDDDGHHGRRERDEGGLVVAAEVDHLEDGERHSRRHHRDGGQPHEVAYRRHRNGGTGSHSLRAHHGGDGGVGSPVHHGGAQRQDDDEGEHRVAHERRGERSQIIAHAGFLRTRTLKTKHSEQ